MSCPIEWKSLSEDEVNERKKLWSGPYSTFTDVIKSANPKDDKHKSILLPKRFLEKKDEIYNFEFKDDDVILMTYPKSGSTWLAEMMWQLQHGLDFETGKSPLQLRAPMLELETLVPRAPGLPDETVAYTKNLSGPRVIKTHLKLDFLPPTLGDKNKIIYLARNPKDLCVSFYHHEMLLQNHGWTGSFDDYVDQFQNGQVAYGNYIDHLAMGLSMKEKSNVMFVWYEDMKRDLIKVMKDLIKFTGWKELSDEQYQELAKHLSFSSFQKNPAVNMEPDGGNEEDAKKIRFIRKGIVGDHKNFFSDEKSAQYDAFLQKYSEKNGIDIANILKNKN